MFAAHMQLAKTVLRHAGRLQDHRIQLQIVAAGLAGDIRRRDRIGGSAGLGLDAAARFIQFLGGDGDGFNGLGESG